MSRAGMVIGTGGLGVSVVHRIRALLTSGPGGKVPDNLRLLAFDLMRPSLTTGRLGQPYYFLVRLPPGEGGSPDTRSAARQILVNDLEKGASSLVLRGLSLNMEALRRAGHTSVDVFLVSSTFGTSGSAWLVDLAYLCRHFGQGRISVNVHAILLAPESCQAAFPITQTHRLTNFAVLKELESLQKERDWNAGVSLYGGKYIAGLPGKLNAAPFASVQILDGQVLGGSPEQSAVPAAAEGILCQMDERVGQILRQTVEARRKTTSQNRNVFSTFGVQVLAHPSRLLTEAGVQRAILGLIECLLPLQKDSDNGQPTGLEAPPALIPSDPYSNVQHWLGESSTSGVLTDVFYQSGLSGPNGPAMRQDWIERLAARDLDQWKATLFQVENADEILPAGGGNPESVVPLIQRHFHVYLSALANKALSLESNPAGPREYLARFESILTDYIADLVRAEDIQKRQGKHSDAVRQAVEISRRDWEDKKASSWSRLFPQRVEEAQQRYLGAMQTMVGFQQREALLGAVRKSASLMLNLTRKLIELYQYDARVLALSRDSLYNISLDHLQRIQRELEQEGAARCQQIVVDEAFEERQIHFVFDHFVNRIFPAVQENLLAIEQHVDWLADSLQVSVTLDDLEAMDGQIDLSDTSREPEETAAMLARWFNRVLGDELEAALSGNSILNFINYLNPRADQLGAHLVERSAPLAKTIVPPAGPVAFLFTPDPEASERSTYVRDLVYELYQQVGELYQIANGDPDRLVLFRRYDGLNLDNLATFHASLPERLDPAELKPYVLWIL